MKLDKGFETEDLEFKSTLSELDKGILSLTAMLNKSGRGKKFYRSGSTDHPLFDKTIDQITAYTR